MSLTYLGAGTVGALSLATILLAVRKVRSLQARLILEPTDTQILGPDSFCFSAMGLGTYFGGWRIVRTIGMKITKLHPFGGFSAETATASTLFAAASLGIPVSTTDTTTRAIMGVGSTRRLSAGDGEWLRRIVYAWVLTNQLDARAPERAL